MNNKIILLSTLVIFAFACDDGDNVVSEKTLLLTLTVDASYAYDTDAADNWIMVHGEDGSLLASESFEANQELEITTDKAVPGKITVTQLRYSVSNEKKSYFANSHVNIEKGKHMILKRRSDSSPLQQTGKLHVTVSNVPFYDHFSVSNSSFALGWDGGSGILTMDGPTYTGFSKYIVTGNDGYSLKHKVLNDVQPNDTFSFSFTDMAPFDQTVDFTFPLPGAVMLMVWGSEPDAKSNIHYIIQHFTSHPHSTIQAGYLNSLTNYTTMLNVSYPDYSCEYKKVGAIPDGNIVWPQKSDFNLSEKSFTNFSATSSKSYVWRESTWIYSDAVSQTSIMWNVSASSGKQSILELPSEITSVHPVLSFNNLKHSSTIFYTQSPAFEAIVDSDFESIQDPDGVQLGVRMITN